MVMVNMLNCGGILALLIFLGIYLPSRMGGRLGAYPRRRTRPVLAIATLESAPRYSDSLLLATSTKNSEEISEEPRNRIFYWYRLVVRLIQGITKALLKPQQTHREFAQESSRVLGPVSKYFIELTKMVERLLYSQYRPTEADVQHSQLLCQKIEEKPKPRVIMQPSLPWQLHREGMGAQFDAKETFFVHREKEFDSSSRVLVTSPWRQLSTWLWVLMILTVAYYACILLFVLPLLVASLAP